MQHLPRTAPECAADLHHLAGWIEAGQQPSFPQPVVQRLLTHRQALGARQGLGDLIAGRGLQEDIASCHPTNAGALRNPFLTRLLRTPTPSPRRFGHCAVAVRHMSPAAGKRGLHQGDKAKGGITCRARRTAYHAALRPQPAKENAEQHGADFDLSNGGKPILLDQR